MKRSPRAPRISSAISPSLHRQLNAYALAAGAAGVSLLALSQAAEAKVVYTKVHKVIGKNGIYGLDLNHDGVIDFLIQEWPLNSFASGSSFSNRLWTRCALGNSVAARKYYAAALKSGAAIGPDGTFTAGSNSGVPMAGVSTSSDFGTSTIWGPWANVKNRYLGVKFKVNGKNHFGWARLTVDVQLQGFSITATLTGYAYETIAGKKILAGQKLNEINSSAEAEAAVPAPRSLGSLALGIRNTARWRKP